MAVSGAPRAKAPVREGKDIMANETKRFEVNGFDAIELRWFGDLVVTQGDSESLEVEGDAELLEKVNAHVDGGTLILELGEDWLERLFGGLRFLGRSPLVYRVNVTDLRRVAVSGRGTLSMPSLQTDTLALAISGQGEMRIDALTTKELTVRISGRGELALRGRAEDMRIDIAGSGDVELPGLETERTRVRISGHGEAEINVRDDLDVGISGYGRVRYHGEPKIKQSIAGAGRVERATD